MKIESYVPADWLHDVARSGLLPTLSIHRQKELALIWRMEAPACQSTIAPWDWARRIFEQGEAIPDWLTVEIIQSTPQLSPLASIFKSQEDLDNFRISSRREG